MTVNRSWDPSGWPRNRLLTWYFGWSYGDSNPRPLACHAGRFYLATSRWVRYREVRRVAGV
jgi:hypothetical protein